MTRAPHDPAWRAAGGLALAVGVVATASPAGLARLYGLPAPGPTGALGWRLFGIRTAVVGVGVLADSADARRVLLPVQALDQVAFLTAGLPRRGTALACATSGLLVALGVRASRAGRT